MMNRAFKRLMGRLLIALLLPALLCPAALADDQTADTWYFVGTGQETFYEATPLPNGCLLLNGSTQLGRKGQEQLPFASGERRAWLLCLNPVSYTHLVQAPSAVQASAAAQTAQQPVRTDADAQHAYVENTTGTTTADRTLTAVEGEQSASASAVIPVDWLSVLAWVWLAGVAAVLALAALSHLRFVRTVRRWQMPCEAEDVYKRQAWSFPTR